MSRQLLGDDEVLALRYDEPAAAADLTSWCTGELVVCAPPTPPTIMVPTAAGPLPARLGDWIVRAGAGDFRPYTPEEFAAHFRPAD